MVPPPPISEGHYGTVLRDLGLRIEGTPLEPVLAEFDRELERVGLSNLRPHYYLAAEWGVPFPSTSLAIPFYLARPDLTALHASRTGLVEGATRSEMLRYLRHEMGHVVNYAHRLYEREDWAARFGPFTRPYHEEYRPRPFSRAFVRHLPGWYAQKHPDEDWAETFAVWMTPGLEWRKEYADWPGALAKLEYCDRVIREVAGKPWQLPERSATGLPEEGDEEEEIDIFELSLAEIYNREETEPTHLPGLDGALRTIFETASGEGGPVEQQPAGQLIQSREGELTTNVYRWTGHFPERTLRLLRQIARRAEELGQVYRPDREVAVTVAVTALVTALAMNHVINGDYVPAGEPIQ